MIGYAGPFWPLFIHVLGAMVLFGAVLTAAIVSWVGWRKPAPPLARVAFWSLLAVAVPAYVAMRGGAQWVYSDEGFSGNNDPTWLKLGSNIADGGLIVLLLAIGAAFWWRRTGNVRAGRIVAGLSAVYLVLLAIAWMAMSGKWGS
jgi:hypothetical protein